MFKKEDMKSQHSANEPLVSIERTMSVELEPALKSSLTMIKNDDNSSHDAA